LSNNKEILPNLRQERLKVG